MLPGVGIGAGASPNFNGGTQTSSAGGTLDVGGYNFNIGSGGFSLARVFAGVDPLTLVAAAGVLVLLVMLWIYRR